MFKSREDLYVTKTFETAVEAHNYVTTKIKEMQDLGLTISRMEVIEGYSYGRVAIPDIAASDERCYVGSVSGYKETAPEKSEAVAENTSVN